MALTEIKTSGIADDAVTTDKLANAINTERTANTAKDLTALSASNLTSGTVPDARFPATLPAASAANLTAIPAANITGTLPAISGANLTGISSPGKARNLIINGAMQVAQRGTSSSATGNAFLTLDRFRLTYSGQDEALTQEQADVASGTTPYSLGFRKCFKLTNGNQTSGAGTTDYARIGYAIEAQDIANSGWNYTSASSYITFQFWIKSSVAQSFKVEFYSDDGTRQVYSIDTGSLSADTWTKVTKTIPGNSNLTFNNDNGEGLHIRFLPFFGTDYTDNSVTENAWASYSGSTRTKDNTSTWWTTNDATFEITGVQLELGSTATDFEHRSFAQELALCQRYFYMHASGAEASTSNRAPIATGAMYSSGNWNGTVNFPVKMRTSPSLYKVQGTDYFIIFGDGGNNTCSSAGIDTTCPQSGTINLSNGLAQTSGTSHWGVINNDLARLGFQAEL